MMAAVVGAKAVRGVHVKDVIEKNFNIVYDEVLVRLQLLVVRVKLGSLYSLCVALVCVWGTWHTHRAECVGGDVGVGSTKPRTANTTC